MHAVFGNPDYPDYPRRIEMHEISQELWLSGVVPQLQQFRTAEDRATADVWEKATDAMRTVDLSLQRGAEGGMWALRQSRGTEKLEGCVWKGFDVEPQEREHCRILTLPRCSRWRHVEIAQ